MSARQRVSGLQCDKTAEHDSRGANIGIRVECGKATQWPESIPLEERVVLSTGHRSFLVGRQVFSEEMLRGREVDIKGHILIACKNSKLLIERPGVTQLVESGQSVLLSNTRVTMSELPSVKDGSGIFYSFCFPDEVLAAVVPMHPRSNAYMFRAADFPSPEGILYLPYEFPANHWDAYTGVRDLLHPILTRIFNRPDFGMWKLCLQQIVVPRLRVQIFLENLLLRRPEKHAGIQDKYPGGRSALHRDIRRLNMPTIAAILDHRRMELCFAWRNYGQRSFDEIAAALCLSQPSRFIARFERWVVEQNLVVFGSVEPDNYSDTLLAAHPSFLPSVRGKYWIRRAAEESLARHLKRVETDESYQLQEELAALALADHPDCVNREIPGYIDPFAPTTLEGEADPAFWEMRNTGVGMIIEAEGLTSISGLEDCADLLLAA